MDIKTSTSNIKIRINSAGFVLIKGFLSPQESADLKTLISSSDYYKSYDETPIHGIRMILKNIPKIQSQLLPKLTAFMHQLIPDSHCIKSLYFNKPDGANWTVPWHQDLFCNLTHKIEDNNYLQWSTKKGYFQVQPPCSVLENILTARLHIDPAKSDNGALKVIPGSHQNGVVSQNGQDYDDFEMIEAEAGDLLLMKPLLLHASLKNQSSKDRMVLHLKYSSLDLPWVEKF